MNFAKILILTEHLRLLLLKKWKNNVRNLFKGDNKNTKNNVTELKHHLSRRADSMTKHKPKLCYLTESGKQNAWASRLLDAGMTQ